MKSAQNALSDSLSIVLSDNPPLMFLNVLRQAVQLFIFSLLYTLHYYARIIELNLFFVERLILSVTLTGFFKE